MASARSDLIERIRQLPNTVWAESPAEMLRRMAPEQRARLAQLRDEQTFLLARGAPSPRLDPDLAVANAAGEAERCVAYAIAARRLARRALGEERAATASCSHVNALSLCAGIGGIDLGLSLVMPSYRTVCYVEKNQSCQDLLLKRMADGVLDRAPIWGDLTRFDGRPWRGLVDLVHGGNPCQPFSAGGKRRGAGDKRNLWPFVVPILQALRPEWYLFENVANHLRETKNVVLDLVGMGYHVALGLFTAEELGAPHERERLFILAHAVTQPQPQEQERGPDAADGRGGGRAGARGEEPTARVAALGDSRAPLAAGPGPLVARFPSPPDRGERPHLWPPGRDSWEKWRAIRATNQELMPSVREDGRPWLNPDFVEWLMGFPRGWTEGVPRTARCAALGNAVVPAAAALAWLELSAALSAS